MWKLVSFVRTRDGRFYRHILGEQATGRIIYTADGAMCAFLMRDGWGKQPDSKAVYDWYVAYSARWSLNGDRVVHQVQFSTIPDNVGKPLERQIVWLDNGDLKLRCLPEFRLPNGIISIDELIWRRES